MAGGSSLLIAGGVHRAITLVLAALVGLVGWLRWAAWSIRCLSRLLDVLWAFPIYLLAISLSIVLINQGLA